MKPRIAVHKFSSCDGCQLAFLNLGEDLLRLADMVDIVHFAEAGMLDEEGRVAIAFVEGSIATRADIERILQVRDNCDYLVTIGACATAGGPQALRNLADASGWLADIYATPEYLDMLGKSSPVREYVKVDLELWGCPVNSRQVVETVRSLLFGAMPEQSQEKVCMECKRRQSVCVLVTKGIPCLGPVTRTGCGALCPRFGRDCYGCYGPAETPNAAALGRRFAGLGLVPEQIANRFLNINSHTETFRKEAERWTPGHDE